MDLEKPYYQSALQDFQEARLKASLQEILASLTGRSNELLSFEEVAEKLKLTSRFERGIREIRLDAIVGSVGRYTDFTRTFLPRSNTNQERWARVKTAIEVPGGTGLPPIDVYQVGDVYFVLDGNHRVSIARQAGHEFIEARVIEMSTNVTLKPGIKPDELFIKAEYADFLEKTDLAALRPGADLTFSIPGQYEKLQNHISVHQYFMGIDLQRDVPHSEAVIHWYDAVYLALVEPIRERGLLRWFPDRTETDLYLWFSEHRAMLEAELGWHISPEAAISNLASKKNPRFEQDVSETGSWRETKIIDRYTENLFKDILVPISGKAESFSAIDQAIIIAQKESAQVLGLHIKPQNTVQDTSQLQTLFTQRCHAAQVNGALAVKTGEVHQQILAYSLLTDLIVLHVAHPPADGLAGFGSGLRTIIRRAARPILTVPQRSSALENAIVAFDGSPKSREALFVAAYLAERWKTQLTIATIIEGKHHQKVQNFAKEYLEIHEIQANFVTCESGMQKFITLSDKLQCDLILMGGYRRPAWQELFTGNQVNNVLRAAKIPIFICR